MASTVFCTDLRAGPRENLHDKLERLLETAACPRSSPRHLTAVRCTLASAAACLHPPDLCPSRG